MDHWNKTIHINGNKPCLVGLVKTMTVSASGDGFGVSSLSSSSSLDSASVFYNKTTNFFLQLLGHTIKLRKTWIGFTP